MESPEREQGLEEDELREEQERIEQAPGGAQGVDDPGGTEAPGDDLGPTQAPPSE
jgi:hypothetical protein